MIQTAIKGGFLTLDLSVKKYYSNTRLPPVRTGMKGNYILTFLAGFLLATVLWANAFPSFNKELYLALEKTVIDNFPQATHYVQSDFDISPSMSSF